MRELLTIGDYFGTFVFAVSGGLAAAEKRFDLGGFFLLAFVTGVGGGTIRDLLLHRGGVFWADQPIYPGLCLAGALAAFFGAHAFGRLRQALVWSDAVGLAVFAVIGAGIATIEGAGPMMAVLMGVLTATGGGVIRDVLRREVPIVLQRELYVSAAAVGASSAVGLNQLGAPPGASLGAGLAAGFAIRAAGIRFDLHLPTYAPPGPR